ncbi:MAG: response regulator [Acidimicrobiia bacterium]
MTRVLVVDDEPAIRRALAVNLEARGYDVDAAATGEEALHLAAAKHPDLVVLDLGLPGISGLEVLHGLRGWTDVPVVILSARESEDDKIRALDAGADDYVTKPFGMGELLARLRAVNRRRSVAPEAAVFTCEHFTVDLANRTAAATGEAVHLTPTEWTIVEALVRSAGRLVTAKQLLQKMWGSGALGDPSVVGTGALRVHLAHIRRKLEPDPARPRYFLTDPGIGYRFVGNETIGDDG